MKIAVTGTGDAVAGNATLHSATGLLEDTATLLQTGYGPARNVTLPEATAYVAELTFAIRVTPWFVEAVEGDATSVVVLGIEVCRSVWLAEFGPPVIALSVAVIVEQVTPGSGLIVQGVVRAASLVIVTLYVPLGLGVTPEMACPGSDERKLTAWPESTCPDESVTVAVAVVVATPSDLIEPGLSASEMAAGDPTVWFKLCPFEIRPPSLAVIVVRPSVFELVTVAV